MSSQADELIGEVGQLRRAVRQRNQLLAALVAVTIFAVLGLGIRFNVVAEEARKAAEGAKAASLANAETLKILREFTDPNSHQRQASDARTKEAVERLLCYDARVHKAAPPQGVNCP